MLMVILIVLVNYAGPGLANHKSPPLLIAMPINVYNLLNCTATEKKY